MSGNYLPQYTDESGSISRRVFAAEFRNHIVDRNTSMKDNIIANELAPIFLRCVKMYRDACTEFHSLDFWKFVAGPEFESMQKDTARATNHLACFLDDVEKIKCILKKEVL